VAPASHAAPAWACTGRNALLTLPPLQLHPADRPTVQDMLHHRWIQTRQASGRVLGHAGLCRGRAAVAAAAVTAAADRCACEQLPALSRRCLNHAHDPWTPTAEAHEPRRQQQRLRVWAGEEAGGQGCGGAAAQPLRSPVCALQVGAMPCRQPRDTTWACEGPWGAAGGHDAHCSVAGSGGLPVRRCSRGGCNSLLGRLRTRPAWLMADQRPAVACTGAGPLTSSAQQQRSARRRTRTPGQLRRSCRP
jgi:hypothetical protein